MSESEIATLAGAALTVEQLSDKIAGKVFDAMRAGLLGLPPEATAVLKRIGQGGGYWCPPMTINGPDGMYLMLEAQVTPRGTLWLRLKNNATGQQLWQAVLGD